MKRPRLVANLPRPQSAKPLPVVLSAETILRLLEAVNNQKHKALFLVMYGGGLRVSEVVRLRLEDLDENRGLIHIRAQEGRKARQTLLSTVALQAVKAYVNRYRPDQWLFPGATPGRHLSISTVEKVLATARKKADIPQKITPRIVRHSFAVHLL